MGWILTLVIFTLQFLLIMISRQKNSTQVLSALLLSSEKEYGGQALAGKATLKISVVLRAGKWARDSDTLGAQTWTC